MYITHDLTTAYQVSENIIVLYRGSIAEVGDVEHVVKDPQHPYTRLLVGSIPLPDPDHAWQSEPLTADSNRGMPTRQGCRFADRCPFVMPVCRESVPPLYRTNPHRAAACFLQRDSPVIEPTTLAEIFVGRNDSGITS